MPSKHDPADCLADLLDNAERIETYLTGTDRQGFASATMVRDAVERCLERVCEAVHRLGEHATELLPDQPLADIRGMGNWLRHAYDRISPDILWNAVHQDLPGLAADARQALQRLERKSHD